MSWLVAVLLSAATGGLVAFVAWVRDVVRDRDRERQRADTLAAMSRRQAEEARLRTEVLRAAANRERERLDAVTHRTRNELARAAEEPEVSEREIWKETGQ